MIHPLHVELETAHRFFLHGSDWLCSGGFPLKDLDSFSHLPFEVYHLMDHTFEDRPH